MGIITPPIPKLGQQGIEPAEDLVESLEQLIDEINGQIEATNLKDRSLDSIPVPRWKETKLQPEIKLCGGDYIPGLPPEYKFGVQNIGAGPPAPADGVLREVMMSLKWSKSAQFSGGNATDNQMVVSMPRIGILVPGSDGLRTQHVAPVVAADRVLVPPIFFTNATVGLHGQQMVVDPGANVIALATGPNGPFSGVFTLHEVTFRYRDWEF